MSAAKYEGIILAAGQGSRMGPFGDEIPKPIAPICNKPLLAYQLDHMRSLGIEDVLIVIGHLGHRITETLGDGSAFGVRLRYVEQERRLGLAHAVGQLEAHVTRPFLLMLGDIFFDVTGLDEMVSAFESGDTAAVLAVKEESDPEAIKRNFAVLLEENGAVRRVIEKPRKVSNTLKGCGLYLFDGRIFEAVRRTPRTAMRDEYELTDAIQILIDYEYPVRAASVVEWDINLTYVGDLVRCCVHQLEKMNEKALVGSGCTLADGVELIHTVVGDGATIARPMRLERCVILPGTILETGASYCDAVIGKDGVLEGESTQ